MNKYFTFSGKVVVFKYLMRILFCNQGYTWRVVFEQKSNLYVMINLHLRNKTVVHVWIWCPQDPSRSLWSAFLWWRMTCTNYSLPPGWRKTIQDLELSQKTDCMLKHCLTNRPIKHCLIPWGYNFLFDFLYTVD